MLGKMFTKAGLAALGGDSDDELSSVLESLVRKDILSIETDPRSPERGQYGFVQALMQRIAYETLSKKRAEGSATCGRAIPRRHDRPGSRPSSSRSSPPTTWTPTSPIPDAGDAGEIKVKGSRAR